MSTKLRLVFAIALFFLSFSGYTQQNYWVKISDESAKQASIPKKLSKSSLEVYELDHRIFLKELSNLKSESDRAVVYFPDENGKMIPYSIQKIHQLSPELSQKYPDIQSYKGVNVLQPEETIWVSSSPNGIQTMSLKQGKSTFIESKKGDPFYYVFSSKMDQEGLMPFVCETKSHDHSLDKFIGETAIPTESLIRTFRVAISASGEYTAYHGGTLAGALSAINATLARVNGVFSKDLGIQLQLVEGEEKIIFTDPETDPFGSDLNSEIQTVLNDSIGASNYDIGHLFHQGSSNGNAGFIGGVCVDNKKGSAFTSGQSPQGDVFDIDYVIHEMGHQLGANHTWSYESEGSGAQVEPGSGTTIMSYAGIVTGENITSHASDYFHGISIYQINRILNNTSCGVSVNKGNYYPEVVPPSNYTIPVGTPFKLKGEAVDANSEDILTYNWEQIDNGVVPAATFGPENPIGASFRSRPSTTSSQRYFPNMSSVLADELTLSNPVKFDSWETLSNIPRSYLFMLTVRDNATSGGAITQVTNKITVTQDAGPFKVNSQAVVVSHKGGDALAVEWDVAKTNLKKVNEQTVSVLYAVDGKNYDQTLASKVPNSGSVEVLLPNTTTTQGRIMVAADSSVFFAINKGDISVEEQTFAVEGTQLKAVMCVSGQTLLPFSFRTNSNATASLSVENVPSGVTIASTASNLSSDGESFTLQINAGATAQAGTYTTLLHISGSEHTQTIPIKVIIRDAALSLPTLTSPTHNAQGVTSNILMEWEPDENAAYFVVEWSTASNFATLSGTQTTTFNRVEPGNLSSDTLYYWRVKKVNNCGSGAFSSPFSFSTQPINCIQKSASDVPISLPSEGTHTKKSTITFTQDLPISSIQVSVNIEHTWVSDLELYLEAPDGTIVPLMVLNCGSGQNIVATFSDDAALFSCNNSIPVVSGTVAPLGKLSVLKGKSLKGRWTLTVIDSADQDGGKINSFTLNACVEGILRPDADEDGVFDDGDDLCLDTPKGVKVDTHGCPIYELAFDHFSSVVKTQSCVGSSDGSIKINSASVMSYQIQLSGPNGFSRTANFTSSYELSNLSEGDYSYCITAISGATTYEPMCFTAHIGSPEPLSVLTAVLYDTKELELQLSGSSHYVLELNGKPISIRENRVKISLEEGVNKIKVSGDKACLGVYEEEIYFSKLPVAYPNPVVNTLSLNTEAFRGKSITFKVFDINSNQIFNYDGEVNDTNFTLDTHNWDTGVYIGILKIDGTSVHYKLIKN